MLVTWPDTDLRMPDWLSRQLCHWCLARMKVLGQETSPPKLILCSFCNQGKYGFRLGKFGELKQNKNSVCVDCLDILDTFKRKFLTVDEETTSSGGVSSDEINEGTNVKECSENFRRMFDNLVSFKHLICCHILQKVNKLWGVWDRERKRIM